MVLGIVDPGVGTDRRAVAIEVGDGQSFLVGPDNGLLASAVGMVGGATGAVELTNTDYQLPAPGPTFAGRDVFAPAAAHLCAGVPLDELGPRIDPHELVPGIVPLPRDEDGAIVGEILWVDRYGNCQLNVDPEAVETWGTAGAAALDPAPRGRAHRGAGRHLRRPRSPARSAWWSTATGCSSVTVARGSAAETLGLEAGRRDLPRAARRRTATPARPATASPARPHVPRHPPAPKAVMRPGTTIVLAVLLALILGASAIQLLIFAR